jgi:nucleotide-binding universal stress UspA family protein
MTADGCPAMIVVGVDEVASGSSAAALEFAAREANRRKLSVKIVHGCASHHQFGPISQSAQADRVSRGRYIVDAAARRISKLTDSAIRVYVTNSLAGGADLLIKESQAAALIVVQRRDLGKMKRVSTGSVTSTVAALARCPVVVVRDAHRRHSGTSLLVGVDGTGRSARALATAAELASERSVPLVVAHAWEVPVPSTPGLGYVPSTLEERALTRASAHRLLAETTAWLTTDYPDLDLRSRLVRGTPEDVLRHLGQEAEMLFVGRHSQTGSAFLALGPVVRSLINTAPCPVLVAPTASSRARSKTLLQVEAPIAPGY